MIVQESHATPDAPAPLLYGQIALVTLLWGVNWPVMKIGLLQVSPWLFRVITVIVAAIFVLSLARVLGERCRVPRHRILPLVAIAAIFGSAWHVLSAYGVLMAGGGRAAIVCYTMPVWAAFLSAIFLDERLRRRHIAGLAFGMAGLLVLIGSDLVKLGAAPWGTVVMLGAAMVWAFQTIGIKAYDWGIGVIALSGWQLLIASVPLTVFWAVFDGEFDVSRLDWQGILSLGYVVFIALGFCFTSFVRLVRVLPASVAAISILGVPIVGVVSSAILVGEPINVADVSALLMVLAALALVLWPQGQTQRDPATVSRKAS